MTVRFWSLPGPRKFLSTLTNSVHDGNSVIIQLPKIKLPDIRLAIKSHDYIGESWSFKIFEQYNRNKPIDSFFERFTGYPPDECCNININKILNNTNFRGFLIWVEPEIDEWRKWLDFIPVYCHAARDIDVVDRCLFLFCCNGFNPNQICISEDIGLKKYKWEGIVNETDLFYYGMFRDSSYSKIETQLRISIASELSCYDLYLVDELLSLPTEILMNPIDLLKKIARDYNWDIKTPICWEEGTKDSNRIHTSIQILNDPALITRRLWKAQVQVLFPRLEIARLCFIKKFEHLFSLPIDTPNGCIDNLYDLEIGAIAYHIRYKDENASRLAEILCSARNTLAHLKPINGTKLIEVMSIIGSLGSEI